ncbi:hypothetical protein CBR_g31263 [Chara braunii]|uniref:Uncharacterized protein n=1 Tax=Chara braunii TaxID=69332 RepID=A0A388JXY0_CHABU|nr:hypothetical protein CBR_g31263 [Chara braunii]|eukprot:GBG62627.1 hypothetical protein CBR_g31263 [Chara braunii]
MILPPDSVITIVLRPLFGHCLKRRRENNGRTYHTLQRDPSVKGEDDEHVVKREVELQHSPQKKNRNGAWEYYDAQDAEAYLRARYVKWRELEANFLSPKDSVRAQISRALSMDFNSIDLESVT